MWRRIKYHPFFIRLTSWEYWPLSVAYIPVALFWIIQSIRARDPFFFTAVNPSMPTGGFFGEEKHTIYPLIPDAFLPGTVYVSHADVLAGSIHEKVAEAGINYPMICKPDIGERGLLVKVIRDAEMLDEHARRIPRGVIIQDYIDYPLELSVMLHLMPESNAGRITSVCRKVFLSVTGDGVRSLAQLIDDKPRAILQKETLAARMDLSRVPQTGEEVLLEAIGNHCRGTQFLNANEMISPELERHMLDIMRRMPGIYYGRFDLRTRSIEDLSAGRAFRIMEFNGASAEPAHIYDPEYSIIHAYRDLWRHWQIMYRIYAQQKRKGINTLPIREGWHSLRDYFRYKKQANLNSAV